MVNFGKCRGCLRRAFVFIWCGLLGSLSIISVSIASVPQAPMDLLEAHLAASSAWSGTFDQTVTDESGRIVQKVSGVLDIQKPMKFFWQTQDPFPQLVISNGSTLWVYDQDLEQVIIRDMSADLAPLPAAILSGKSELLKDLFDIREYVEKKPKEQVFQLKPKDFESSGEFELLTLEFKAGQLQTLQLLDALGQTTTLVMGSQVTNPILHASRFEFALPKGVDVIDERL